MGRINSHSSVPELFDQGPVAKVAGAAKSLVALALDFLRRIIRRRLHARHTNQTTHCTRVPPRTHLHSSQWQGTFLLQLLGLSHDAPRRATTRTAHTRLSAHSSILTRRQLGLPREPCTALPARVPEARWLEDMGEGTWSLCWRSSGKRWDDQGI
jgi:squalene cyclase